LAHRQGLQLVEVRHAALGGVWLGVLMATLSAGCTPTVRVVVAPINIYAKLDANVRVRLDREVQSAIQQNPGLF
jgi:hypothetical protein